MSIRISSIHESFEARVRHVLVIGALAILPAFSALAGSHTWDVNEVFTDSTGHIQFVELVEANGTPNETGVPGHTMTSNAKSFVISGPALASPTTDKFYLIATADFAALPGAPTPDAIIPAGVLPFFFTPSGDSVTYVPWDTLTFGSAPTDGVTSLNGDLSTGVNSPTNYAGTTGSVDVSAPATTVPLLGDPGVAVLLALMLGVSAATIAIWRGRTS